MAHLRTGVCGILGGLLLSLPAFAQQATEALLSGCGNFDAERRLELEFAAPLSAGKVAIVAVAAAPVTSSGLTLSDSRGHTFAPLAARRARADATSVLLFAARLHSGILVGDRLRLQLDTTADTSEACATAIGYSDLLWETYALRASAARRGSNTAPVAPATSPATQHARLAAFSFAGSPGATSAAAGIAVVGPNCSDSATLCLAFAHAEGGSGSSAASDIALTTTQAVEWQAAVAILPRFTLFEDGLED